MPCKFWAIAKLRLSPYLAVNRWLQSNPHLTWVVQPSPGQCWGCGCWRVAPTTKLCHTSSRGNIQSLTFPMNLLWQRRQRWVFQAAKSTKQRPSYSISWKVKFAQNKLWIAIYYGITIISYVPRNFKGALCFLALPSPLFTLGPLLFWIISARELY